MRLLDLIQEEFGSLTMIQEQAYSLIFNGKDVLISAPTGTGKTEAAMAPLIDRIINDPKPLSIIYITPLKSLNRDLISRFNKWASRLGFRAGVRHGDTPQKERAFQSKHPPHLLITTPETFQSILCSNSFKNHLSNVRAVVVDELHELLNSKRGAQLSLGLTRLTYFSSSYQVVGISATLNSDPDMFFRDSYEMVTVGWTSPPSVEVIRVKAPNENLQLSKIVSKIKSLISKHNKTLTFTNTRYMAELIGSHLIMDGLNVGVHHGSLSRDERESVENRFKSGDLKHLVCTSSLELGIDIGDVDLVIHIGSPRQVRKALQRIGRSGHGVNKTSKGVFITLNAFDFNEGLSIADWAVVGKIEPDNVIYPSIDVLFHAVVGIVMNDPRISIDELYNFISENPLYSYISREKFELVLWEMHKKNLIYIRDDNTLGLGRRAYNYYFTRLSTIPSAKRFKLISKGRIIGELDERFVYNLNEGDVFITKGVPWVVLSIEDDSVVVDRAHSYTLAIPDWEGEQIPVSNYLARDVAKRMGYDRPRVEVYGDLIVFYSFLGSRGNYALGLALGNALSRYYNVEVSVKSSPYAIFLQSPIPVSEDVLRDLLKSLNVKNEIFSRIDRNELFGYILSHVLMYMGYFDQPGRLSPSFITRLEGTLAYDEAVNYFRFKYCDWDLAQSFVQSADDLLVKFFKEMPSDLRELLSYMSGSQVILPEFPESAIDNILSNLPTSVKFRCVNCGFEFYSSFSDLPKKCPNCGSVLLAPLDKRVREYSKDELHRRASMYLSYNRRAIIALSMYGVGTDTAMRILGRLHRDERSLVLDLLKAREQFLRTKKYWKP